MQRFDELPKTYDQARPQLEAFVQEAGAIARLSTGSRRRPQPPRSVMAQAGSLEILLTWSAPADAKGIVGWRVYRDTESNLVGLIDDFGTRRWREKVPANTSIAFYISSINAKDVQSNKVPVMAKANADQYDGASNGSQAPAPVEYQSEPRGGASGGDDYRFNPL